MIVDLFIPCFIDQIYPEVAHNVVKILEKAGVTVNYNPNQTCCGQFAFNSGYWKEAKRLAKNFLSNFQNEHPIITPSASCAAYIKKYYTELLKEPKEQLELQRIQQNLFEFTDFLVNKLKIIDFGSEFDAKVTYHDSCAALREYGIKDEPRILLSKVKKLELIEMKNVEECCGFGGTFSLKYEPIATALLERKIDNALTTHAQYIVSTEASCFIHQQGYIDKHKLPIKTIHIADVLAHGI